MDRRGKMLTQVDGVAPPSHRGGTRGIDDPLPGPSSLSFHFNGLTANRNLGTHRPLCLLRQWFHRPFIIPRLSGNARHRGTVQAQININSWGTADN